MSCVLIPYRMKRLRVNEIVTNDNNVTEYYIYKIILGFRDVNCIGENFFCEVCKICALEEKINYF